jgi:hypothetical protein
VFREGDSVLEKKKTVNYHMFVGVSRTTICCLALHIFFLFVYSVLAYNTLKFQWDTGTDINVMLVTLHVTALEVTISLNVCAVNLESCRY